MKTYPLLEFLVSRHPHSLSLYIPQEKCPETDQVLYLDDLCPQIAEMRLTAT